jgi:hypothetical protein
LAAQKYLAAFGDYLIVFLKKYWSVLFCDLAEKTPQKIIFPNIFWPYNRGEDCKYNSSSEEHRRNPITSRGSY